MMRGKKYLNKSWNKSSSDLTIHSCLQKVREKVLNYIPKKHERSKSLKSGAAARARKESSLGLGKKKKRNRGESRGRGIKPGRSSVAMCQVLKGRGAY